jgi:hypothetical protein
MSWLTDATKAAGVPKTSIIANLKKNMAGWEEARPISVVHASDITKTTFCPRHWAFLDMTKKEPVGSFVSTALRATYDLGHKTAEVLIEDWAEGFAVGNWKCNTCNAQRTMTVKPPKGCGLVKGSCDWKYQEVSFVSKEYGVSGSIDVFFDLGALRLITTELKTYAADEFDKMVAPLPEHRIRTQLYLKLIADSNNAFKDRINLHEARIFYTSRGFGRKNVEHNEILPFREFTVLRDDEYPDLAKALARAKQIKVFREEGLMPGGICGSPADKVAKSCSNCQVCFSGQHPAQQVGSLL